jgi:hypothetical protein
MALCDSGANQLFDYEFGLVSASYFGLSNLNSAISDSKRFNIIVISHQGSCRKFTASEAKLNWESKLVGNSHQSSSN